MLPQLAVHGHLVARYVVRNRHPRQLDDAALDGVHEGEIAHRPGKQGALRVAGTTEEKGRGGEIDHPRRAELAVQGLEAGDPEPRRLPVLLGCLLFVSLEYPFLSLARFLAVAVVGLVVQHQDVLQPQEPGHHPLQHLSFGFEGIERGATALEE